MGFWKEIEKTLDNEVERQGFEDGVRGATPRLFFGDGGSHKKAYDKGYEKGQQAVLARAINRLLEE